VNKTNNDNISRIPITTQCIFSQHDRHVEIF